MPDQELTEAEIVDNYRTDTLYTHKFKNEAGKYFTIVSVDESGTPETVEVEHPYPIRNKVKTTFAFIKKRGEISQVSFKRFKYYKKPGWVGQGEQITFSYPFFKQIIGYLQLLSGLDLGEINERRIALAEDNLPTLDDDTKKKLRTLILRRDGQELIRELLESGLITSTDVVNIGYRKAQLAEFDRLLNEEEYIETYRKDKEIRGSRVEDVWQHYFEANRWIFGYGLNFVFNDALRGDRLQQAIQGTDVSQRGKRVDALLRTRGIISSVCLVEIKTHVTPLLKGVASAYRPESWQISDELNGGVVQSQRATQKTIENIKMSPELRLTDKHGNPTGDSVFSYQPKSYLVVGRLSEFVTESGINSEKFSSFDLFRKNTLAPEIITFDELYERARFIVGTDVAS